MINDLTISRPVAGYLIGNQKEMVLSDYFMMFNQGFLVILVRIHS